MAFIRAYPPGCFVYAITANGVTRYIGKGTGNRLARHFRRVEVAIAIRARGGLIRTSNLHHMMIKALAAGDELSCHYIVTGLDDAAACERERQEIAAHEGLWNLREGGEGWTSAEMRRMWQDEAHRAHMIASMQEQWRDPEIRRRRMEGLARAWQDSPAMRAGLDAGRAPEVRKRQGVTLKARLEEPAMREKWSEAQRKRWTPERKAAHIAKWTPEKKDEHASKIRAALAKKREAKNNV